MAAANVKDGLGCYSMAAANLGCEILINLVDLCSKNRENGHKICENRHKNLESRRKHRENGHENSESGHENS
jgi:hypothetical protein